MMKSDRAVMKRLVQETKMEEEKTRYNKVGVHARQEFRALLGFPLVP